MNNSTNDFSAIQNLYSKYCFGLDGNNPELLMECFTPNGIFQVAEREFQGPEQLSAIARNGANRPRHHYSNLWVKSIEGARAQASAYFFLLDLSDGSCAGYGYYDDDMVCDANRVWRFQHRRVVFLWQSETYKARTNAITKK
jgi:hypothetical protein